MSSGLDNLLRYNRRRLSATEPEPISTVRRVGMAGMLNKSNEASAASALLSRPLDGPHLTEFQDRAREWLFERALPWWAAHSWDEDNGGVVEAFTFDGKDAALPIKRTRVLCRQIYVFSHAHVLGWSDGLELAQRCVRHLTESIWAGPQKGFPRLLTRSGAVKDPTIDLYDHAFALFGLAWHARATGSRNSLDWTYRTLDFIEEKLRHPTQPGFLHQTPVEGPRLQNPHMHLTEACLVAFETTGDNRFRDIAREIVDLFTTRFCDPSTGALYESFTDDLKPVPGPDGKIVEPGHQFEWSWILNALRPHLAVDVAPVIRTLHDYAERHGVDPRTGAVRDAISSDGVIIAGGSRTWPNTERVKSAIAIQELDGTNVTPILEQTCSLLFDRYLGVQPNGTWADAFDARGKLSARNVPTSTLYHLFLAFAELLRFRSGA